MSHSPWHQKTVVVCGASAGLGRDFARELAEQQVSNIALISRSMEGLHTLRDELLAAHGNLNVLCLPVDLLNKPQLGQAAQQIQQDFGNVDLLVQAVGKSDRGELAELTDAKLHELIAINVLTSLHALQCFESTMRQPSGSFVLVGSLASKFAPRFLGGYAIAKHGLAALAQQARLELADKGLHVLLACPGPIARHDAGERYQHISHNLKLPDAVRQPGGGAKLQGLAAGLFVREVLRGVERRKPQIIRPHKAQWLVWISALSCRLGDRLLRKNSA